MCKCGCGTCETKITGPLLTESKVKSLLSEGLNHHISNEIPLHETVYRYGSEKHLALIKEARKLYSRNVIDLNEFDTELVKTHLGEWGVYEGESVPLDLPMMNEEYYQVVANLGDKKTKENLDSFEEVQDFMDKIQKRNAISVDVTKVSERGDSQTIKYDWVGDKWKKVSKFNVNEDLARGYNWPASKATQDRKDMGYDLNDLLAIKNSLKKKGFNVKVGKPTEIDPKIQIQYIDGDLDDLQATLNDMLGGEGYRIVFDTNQPMLEKAKTKKKKDPPLGKPKRGGSKAYYVYVRDPKTKRIKKVSFGSGGLRAKINNPKARSAFAKRHRCSEKNDRTKPSYWSCRLPRYAKALGLGNNSNTFW